jgi:predicted Holliday junction resolvase-like endonuclease
MHEISIGLIIIVVLFVVVLFYLFHQIQQAQGKLENVIKNYESQIKDIHIKHQQEIKKARLQSVETSRHTIKGQIAEQLAPLLLGFPYLPSDSHFIGNPIDYVVFNGYTNFKDKQVQDDSLEVVILDIKYNNASLSEGQKTIAKAIEAGRVRFEVVRILDDGTVNTHSWNYANGSEAATKISPVELSPTDDFIEDSEDNNAQRAVMLKLLKQHPNAYKSWDSAEDYLLKNKFYAGAKICELSELLQRQPSAIQARLKRKGLLLNPSKKV